MITTPKRVILTTNVKDEQDLSSEELEQFDQIKSAFIKTKALTIKINEEERAKTTFESINHFYVMCEQNLDKFLILFSFIKLAIVEGKCVVMVNDLINAYRIKFFLAKFSLKSFVLSPEMPKKQISSITHFFHIGQFDIIIMLHSGYSARPIVKETVTVLNFDLPLNFNQYKEAGMQVTDEEGCVLSLINPDDRDQMDQFETIRRKMIKHSGQDDVMKCVPILWNEIVKFKSRVEAVLGSLSNKAVNNEKVLEFKK